MKLFMIKKTFFDMWDNLFKIFILNLGYIVVIGVILSIPYFINLNNLFVLIWGFLGILIFNIYSGFAFLLTIDMSDYIKSTSNNIAEHIMTSVKVSLLLTIIDSLLIFLAIFTIPFYFNKFQNLLGYSIAFLFIWLIIITALSLLNFFPIKNRINRESKTVIIRCYSFFFDNIGFIIYLFIGIIVILVISSITAFLLPGLTVIPLWISVGFKLRVKKYEYYDEHSDIQIKRIPWHKLLKEERELLGRRTFKGLIFPWKD